MAIKAINNYNFTKRSISFEKKYDKKEQCANQNSNSKQVNSLPAFKYYPALAAIAGMTTLNSCTKDQNYAEMRMLKSECFENIQGNEKNLAMLDEKTVIIDTQKDSLYRETKDYSYRHLRIKSDDHTRVFGEITRKKDDKSLEFINVYDEEERLVASTLKDPKTEETFYVNYKKGLLDKVTDKNGEELPSSKYGDYFILFLAACSVGGIGHFIRHSFAPNLTNKDVPFVEPPKNDD